MVLKEKMISQGNVLFKNRSYLPLVIIVVGIIVYIFKERAIDSSIHESQSQWLEIGSLFIAIVGFIIRMITIGYTYENTSGRNTTVGQVADAINKSGLYSILRHPLYLGNFLIWLGIASLTQNLWFIIAFVFIYWVYYERIMLAEEEFLLNKFKGKYEDYAENVPAFFPNFKQWSRPILPFSFKKVFIQERSGILNLFLVIFIMRIIGEWSRGSVMDVEPYWLFLLLFALLWYVTSKILQKFIWSKQGAVS